MFIKVIRLGNDSELRATKNGKQVLGFSGAYDIGWGENKRTQWVSVSVWGKQAEALHSYLIKGVKILIEAKDLHVEMYKDKPYLKCTAVNVELIGKREEQQQQQPSAITQEDTFSDDIPF